jgi:hypothetical protein
VKAKAEVRTPGPADCLRTSRLAALCDTCGLTPETIHSPLNVRGFYCSAHCPVCGGKTFATAATAPAKTEVRQ